MMVDGVDARNVGWDQIAWSSWHCKIIVGK